MFLAGHPHTVPIVPVSVDFQQGGNTFQRTQLPLSLAYALTVHKSQGTTLDHAIVSLGSREFSPGMSFVAISRLRRLEHLVFDSLTWERYQKINTPALRQRLEFEETLKQLHLATTGLPVPESAGLGFSAASRVSVPVAQRPDIAIVVPAPMVTLASVVSPAVPPVAAFPLSAVGVAVPARVPSSAPVSAPAPVATVVSPAVPPAATLSVATGAVGVASPVTVVAAAAPPLVPPVDPFIRWMLEQSFARTHSWLYQAVLHEGCSTRFHIHSRARFRIYLQPWWSGIVDALRQFLDQLGLLGEQMVQRVASFGERHIDDDVQNAILDHPHNGACKLLLEQCRVHIHRLARSVFPQLQCLCEVCL